MNVIEVAIRMLEHLDQIEGEDAYEICVDIEDHVGESIPEIVEMLKEVNRVATHMTGIERAID